MSESALENGQPQDDLDFAPLLKSSLSTYPSASLKEREVVYELARQALREIIGKETLGAREELGRRVVSLEAAIADIESTLSEVVKFPSTNTPIVEDVVSAKPIVDERRKFALNAISGGAANIFKIIIQLVLLPLMAHLLGPTEFGLYSLALPTISLLAILADGGLGTSLAREDEASTSTWSTAFWALLVSCSLMGVLSIVISIVISRIVEQPRLVGIVGFLSVSFILLAFSALPAARLIRRGNLVIHSVADLTATFVGAGTGVTLALWGAGAWSLAAQFVVSGFVSCLIFNFAAFEFPRLEFDFKSLKSHAVIGGSIIGGRLSELGGRQLENLLCGRFFGTTFLGSYTFANQTSRFLCESAGNPVWGALYSYTLREKSEVATRLYMTLTRLLAMLLFPLTALAAVIAPNVFAIVLGERWTTAGAFMQVIVVSYAFSTIGSLCGAVLLANGRSSLLFWAFTALSVGRVLAVILGLIYGAMGMGISIDLVNILFAGLMIVFMKNSCNVEARVLVRSLIPSLVASLVAGTICYLVSVSHIVDLFWTATALISGLFGFVIVMLILQSRRLYADFGAVRRIAFPG